MAMVESSCNECNRPTTVLDRFYDVFPCLADSSRRSSLGLKVSLVMLHLIYAGFLFLFDNYLIETTKDDPWFITLYILLFVATLIQYFVTSCWSPGYVLDAMRALNEQNATFEKASVMCKKPTPSKDGGFIFSMEGDKVGITYAENGSTSWAKLVVDMYPSGTSVRTVTCAFCNVEQPPRAKHCHDCDKCVLQFDHHCVWLGTCIGQGNHCQFWWYICEETLLCLWTTIFYVAYLKENITIAWWKDVIMIILLCSLLVSMIFLVLLLVFHSYLVLTNQTTYELVRRRRIPYLRGIPERVYPFSKGMCRNLYEFCCATRHAHDLEHLPTVIQLAEKSRPYSCFDYLICRCC